MHGFPLTIAKIRKRMHRGKLQYPTKEAAHVFNSGQTVYLCPFCCMYHMSGHKPNPRYEQERWWIIWHKEVENA